MLAWRNLGEKGAYQYQLSLLSKAAIPKSIVPTRVSYKEITMKNNIKEAAHFLDFLSPTDKAHTFQMFRDSAGEKGKHAKLIHGKFGEVEAQLARLNRNKCGIFFAVNETNGKGRKAANIVRVRAVFLDLDGATLEPVMACPLKPHCVVESSPGKYHVYWLAGDCPLSDFKPIQQALARKFNGDASVCDLPRVMRLPGFYHHKGEPFLTRVLEINEHAPYFVAETIERLKLELTMDASIRQLSPVDINKPLEDGERTQALTRIIGTWIRQVFNNDAILDGLQTWNSRNIPPLPYSKLENTLESIRRSDDEKLSGNFPELYEFNSRYAVVPLGGKTVVMDTVKNNPISFEDFRRFYINRPRVGNQLAANYWLTHPKRRQYEAVDFLPEGANDSTYNLWRGFSCEPKAGNCQLYLDHIRDNICDGDQAVYQYLLDWMAHAVQHPADLPGVAIVLMGRQGTGKGVFVRHFGKLFGKHYKLVTSQEQLLGRFNSLLADSLIVFMDEAFWGGQKEMEGTLKTLITEPDRMVEFKGKDVIPMKNYNRVIMATNSNWAIPAGLEERRFLSHRLVKSVCRTPNIFRQ